MSISKDSDKLTRFDGSKKQCDAETADMKCKIHSSEKVTLYCYPCKESMCIECLRYEHKSLEHHYESIFETEIRLDKELIAIKNKIDDLESTQLQGDKYIEEIDFQYYQVEDKINETYQALENLLNEYRDKSLTKLKKLRKSRKSEVIETYVKINECYTEIDDKIKQCSTQISRNDNTLDHIAVKEKLIEELADCVDQMSKLNQKFHVDFNKFNEKCFSEMMDNFSEMIDAQMFQRIYHSSNPFLDKLTEIQKLTSKQVTIDHYQIDQHHLNTIDEETDIDCNSSDGELTSPQSQESSLLSQEQPEETEVILTVEEKSSASNKTNNSTEDDDSKDAPTKYDLAKNFNHNFIPESLKLVKKFNDFFACPQDFCVNANGDIIVADTGNHEIRIYDQCGNYKLKFGNNRNQEGSLIYPKFVKTFNNANSQNFGKMVVYDQRNHRCRLQIFTEVGVFLQCATFKDVAVLKALTTTMDTRIIAIDKNRQIFIISDSLVIVKKIDCKLLLTAPLDLAVKDNEIFITDIKNHYVIVIDVKGHFLGWIGFEKQNFSPQGICFIDDKIIFSGREYYSRVVNFYEYSRNGSCSIKYKLKNIKVFEPDRFQITKDGSVVLLSKGPVAEMLILKS